MTLAITGAHMGYILTPHYRLVPIPGWPGNQAIVPHDNFGFWVNSGTSL